VSHENFAVLARHEVAWGSMQKGQLGCISCHCNSQNSCLLLFSRSKKRRCGQLRSKEAKCKSGSLWFWVWCRRLHRVTKNLTI